ncbi:hypothetical protein [Brevibacillus sp. BC25]|uniref:hypothetical protein n=1 Tax=Brevibacillus sp. BC25 TaxID=1144308 RepID=UPI000270DD60|nr:hypothetical protein [Brevibacillus sp. BC25]EJL31785.1 hypothetical protein PMI05_00550 [Brevibacillus sp. BC25]
MMKFELADKQKEQRDSKQQKVMAMAEQEQKAREELVALKHQYEQAMVASVSAGKGITDEIDALGVKVEEAEKALKRRQQERQVYSTNQQPGTISADDIVREWNEVFVPDIRKEQLEPVLKEMLRAKKAVIDASVAYRKLMKEFEAERYRVVAIAGDGVQYKLNDIAFQRTDEREKYFITRYDEAALRHGEIPSSFQNVRDEELQ